jgi:phospholipid/cholesterol/gamma-HCH transport system substrate-binding protein
VRGLQQATANFQMITGEMQVASMRFNSLLTKVDSGNVSMAKLLNDPEIYDNLRKATARVDSLILDLMKNPRKYLKFSVF